MAKLANCWVDLEEYQKRAVLLDLEKRLPSSEFQYLLKVLIASGFSLYRKEVRKNENSRNN
jgi:hypothetical protein